MASGMGCFSTTIGVSHQAHRETILECPGALVDTGSELTWIPRDVLESLGVKKEDEVRLITATGLEITRDVGWAIVLVGGRAAPDIVVFAEAGDMVLLGAHSLEGLNYRVDPVEKRLVDRGPILAAAAA
jgi:predicted aspartyl protease